MKKKTLIGVLVTFFKNITRSFNEAFAGNLFAGSVGSVNPNHGCGNHWCVVDRIFYN